MNAATLQTNTAPTRQSNARVRRDPFSTRMLWFAISLFAWCCYVLRLAFRVPGVGRYATLMTYLGYISSLRNQREVLFGTKNDKA